MFDKIQVQGDVHITIYDADHNIKEERDFKNLIVDTGKKFIANKIASPPQLMWGSTVAVGEQYYYNGYIYEVTTGGTLPSTPVVLTTTISSSTTASPVVLTCAFDLTSDGVAIKYMAIGTSSVTPVFNDTSLGATQFLTRQPVLVTYTPGSSTPSVTYSATFSGSVFATTSITEAGLFCESVGGIMVCRTTFGTFEILTTDTIGISWTLSIL